MSLQFVIGRSGCGKSKWILDEITSKLKVEPTGSPLILLAPEQGTFQIEQAIVNSSGIRGTVRAQVLGFRRLALRVMQETGGSALVPISEEGKKMLLYTILRRHRDKLKLYGRAGDQVGIVSKMNELYTEMKKYTVRPFQLESYLSMLNSAEGKSSMLEDKLHDLGLLFQAFDQELENLYIDAEDHVLKLTEGAGEASFLQGAEIWIDGFHTFTPQEYEAIAALLKTVSSVTVALTLDRPYDDDNLPHELNMFHSTATAYIKLRNIAESLGIEVKPVRMLDQRPYPRFGESETLSYLEYAYERRTRWNMDRAPQDLSRALQLSSAADRRTEVEGAAMDMVRLVRDHGARWRDMALFVRNIADYESILTQVFEDYRIPYFLDQKVSVLHHPVIEFMRGALDVILRYWKYEDVFRCVKSDFLLPLDGSITRADMDVLENYVLASGIHGYRWYDGRPWKKAPDLSLESTTSSGSSTDGHDPVPMLERCRAAIAGPLATFEKRMKRSKTAGEMCRAVYQLLEDVGAPDRLDIMAHRAVQDGHPRQAMEHRQIWSSILSLLDQIVEMMGDEEIEMELFAGVFETGLKELKLSVVPPAIDQVLIGSTDRTRTSRIKHLYLLGINEGIMPSALQEDGVLSDQERSLLGELGMRLGPGMTRKLLDERFMIYNVLSAACNSIWLSYPVADEDGKSMLPSEVIRQVKTIFPPHILQERYIGGVPQATDDLEVQLNYVQRPTPAISHMINQLRSWKSGSAISPLWWSVLGWYQERPEWNSRLTKLLGSLNYRNHVTRLSAVTSRKLYGKRLRTSVSRMEKFSACPFSHFASHGLRLRERQMYMLKAPDIGQLFHAALSMMALTFREQNRSWGTLTPEECRIAADEAVDQLAPKLQGEILLSTKRYRYISRKLKNIVTKASIILREHARRGHFEPIGLELDFGQNGPLPPLVFELPNGCVMEIVGRIDRVDVAEGENGLLLRVIDYKSSQTDLKLHEVYFGLSLQMLTYLDVLLSSSEAWLGEKALPAGTLYFHVHNPLLQSSNAMTPEQAEAEVLKRFKMKGLLLADRDVIHKMDASLEKGYSEILPVAIKADGGFYSSASVATLEQWQSLLRSVRSTISDIGTRITDGDVKIAPYRLGTESACTHCAFKAVCRFEESLQGSEYNLLRKPGKQEIWSRFEGNGGTEREVIHADEA